MTCTVYATPRSTQQTTGPALSVQTRQRDTVSGVQKSGTGCTLPNLQVDSPAAQERRNRTLAVDVRVDSLFFGARHESARKPMFSKNKSG